MASFGTGNPFTEDFRLLRGIPATLNGTLTIATNDVLVVASRKDPWIRAASTNFAPATPAFIRGGIADKIISFDFYLCSGNGEPVPSDCVELIFPAATTNVATGVSNGASIVLQENISAAGLLAAAGALLQAGRRVILRASTAGRVTGTLPLDAAGDLIVTVKYRHITTSLTTTLLAT